jgi:tetratricopeptide (TPR) repeat protein
MTERRRPLLLLFLAAVLLWIAGCASSPPPSRPWLEAVALNERGIRAQEIGKNDVALALFAEALRLHASIENETGMIVALVNIARTHRLLGNLDDARQAAQRAAKMVREGMEEFSTVLFEQAKIAFAAGEHLAAKASAEAALASAGKDLLAARHNLLARIHFSTGELPAALRHAEQALGRGRAASNRGEEANAHRLLGEIRLAQGDADQAAHHFNAALTLDRQLGRSAAIVRDLIGLAEVSLLREERPAALAYLQRAASVSASYSSRQEGESPNSQLRELRGAIEASLHPPLSIGPADP